MKLFYKIFLYRYRKIIEHYPFLVYKLNILTGWKPNKTYKDNETCWLNKFPNNFRKLYGYELLEKIREEALKHNLYNDLTITSLSFKENKIEIKFADLPENSEFNKIFENYNKSSLPMNEISIYKSKFRSKIEKYIFYYEKINKYIEKNRL